jgi:hypothetical protein
MNAQRLNRFGVWCSGAQLHAGGEFSMLLIQFKHGMPFAIHRAKLWVRKPPVKANERQWLCGRSATTERSNITHLPILKSAIQCSERGAQPNFVRVPSPLMLIRDNVIAETNPKSATLASQNLITQSCNNACTAGCASPLPDGPTPRSWSATAREDASP